MRTCVGVLGLCFVGVACGRTSPTEAPADLDPAAARRQPIAAPQKQVAPRGPEQKSAAELPGIYIASDEGCSTTDHRSASAAGASTVATASDASLCTDTKRSVEYALGTSGVRVVGNRDAPHEYVGKLRIARTLETHRKGGAIVKTLHTTVRVRARLIVEEQGALRIELVADIEREDQDVDADAIASALVEKFHDSEATATLIRDCGIYPAHPTCRHPGDEIDMAEREAEGPDIKYCLGDCEDAKDEDACIRECERKEREGRL